MSETIKEIGLNRLGLNESDFVFRNLPVETLVQDIIANNEGSIAANGAAMVDTGSYTGRSPKDKYIVKEPSCSENIWWGPINQEITDDVFDLSLIHICRCRRSTLCRSRWSPYH